MYAAKDVVGVHLELTTRCNAACPMCPRNVSGGKTTDFLPLVELSLSDMKKVLPDDFVRQMKWLYMCGNYGDALAAKDTLEIFAHLKKVNPKLETTLITNGGGRDAGWWKKLAGVVDKCTFSIDGLEDTNHLYRRGVVWKTLMRSVEAYLSAKGGQAHWDYLVFKHNEHQVEEARALAKKLGFSRFTVKRTSRFFENGKPVDAKAVLDESGREEYRLEMPTAETDQNAVLRDLKSGGDWRKYLDETPVKCKVLDQKQVYVSAEGLVFPCCWTAKLYDKPGKTGEEWRFVEKLPGGKDALDAKKHDIRSIINGPYFQELVPGTWKPGAPSRRESAVCMRVCGVKDANAAQRPAGAAVDFERPKK